MPVYSKLTTRQAFEDEHCPAFLRNARQGNVDLHHSFRGRRSLGPPLAAIGAGRVSRSRASPLAPMLRLQFGLAFVSADCLAVFISCRSRCAPRWMFYATMPSMEYMPLLWDRVERHQPVVLTGAPHVQGSEAQKMACKGSFIWWLFARRNHNCMSDFAGGRERCRCRLSCR